MDKKRNIELENWLIETTGAEMMANLLGPNWNRFHEECGFYPNISMTIADQVWEYKQKRINELQAECDQLEMQILRSKFFRVHKYSNQNIERLWREFIKKSHRCIECSNFDVCSCGGELEQALKGGDV